MQNKLSGKQTNGKENSGPVPATYDKRQESREEFSDWPHGLLAIGTFGTNDARDPQIQEIIKEENNPSNVQEERSSSDDLDEFTPEEVGKLEKELTKLLSKKPKSVEKELANLPLDRFLNCPSSLEVDRRISVALCSDTEEIYKDEDIDRTISVILGRCKDICAEKKKSIGKKSISFLLKKLFVCSNGFGPQPSLRDTLQESRMEKLLRMMLHKKLNTQNCSRASSMKRYLQDKQTGKKQSEEDFQDSRKSTWVKTDSEYIVLEI